MDFNTIYILLNHQMESEKFPQLPGLFFNNHFDMMIDRKFSYECKHFEIVMILLQ